MITKIKKVDELGRFIIPKHYRDKLGIRTGDELNVTLDGNVISIRKPQKLADLDLAECMGCVHVGQNARMCARCAANGFLYKEV